MRNELRYYEPRAFREPRSLQEVCVCSEAILRRTRPNATCIITFLRKS